MTVRPKHALVAVAGKLAENHILWFVVGVLVAGNYFAVVGIVLTFPLMMLVSGYGEGRSYNEELKSVWMSFLKKDNLQFEPILLETIVSKKILREVETRPTFGRPGFHRDFILDVLPLRASTSR